LISNQIVQQVKTQLPTIINTNVNADLQNLTVVNFPNITNLAENIALTGTPVVSANGWVGAEINGTFFDPQTSYDIPYTVATIPPRDEAGKDFQLFLTDYTVNTHLLARHQAKEQVDITAYLSQLGVSITTDKLGAAIPQLVTKYGSGVPVTVKIQLTKEVPQFKFTTADASLTGSNIITLVVNGENALVAENDGASIVGHITNVGGKIFGKIESYSLGTITIQSTTLGVDSATLATEFNTFVKNNVDAINVKLAAGIALPTIAGINISDGEIKNFDGYIQLGITLSKAAKLLEFIQ